MADDDFTCTYSDLHSLTHHKVSQNPLYPPYPEGNEVIYFGMGCFWCPEQLFWETDGVFVTSVGYMGGHLKDPSYEDVCEGSSGHTEAVKVVYDSCVISIDDIFQIFISNHNPFRRRKVSDELEGEQETGPTGKSQYKSCIWCTTESQFVNCRKFLNEWTAGKSSDNSELVLATEVFYPAPVFYPAEDRHQQYMSTRKKRSKPSYCFAK